jgi:hypothetical protein
MARVAHAVTAVNPVLGLVRCHRVVAEDLLDLEVDLPALHESLRAL